jgi:hypothetical protein
VPPPVVFSDVWQAKDLKAFVFGCVAMIRLTGAICGCVAMIGLSRFWRVAENFRTIRSEEEGLSRLEVNDVEEEDESASERLAWERLGTRWERRTIFTKNHSTYYTILSSLFMWTGSNGLWESTVWWAGFHFGKQERGGYRQRRKNPPLQNPQKMGHRPTRHDRYFLV